MGGGAAYANVFDTPEETYDYISKFVDPYVFFEKAQPSPIPINLQNVVSFSRKEEFVKVANSFGEKFDVAQTTLQEARKQYLASINTTGIKQAMDEIKPIAKSSQCK